jgi:uncharacterized protein
MIKQIFVNLPVKDLTKTKEFFAKLGFTFNPQFTDEKAAALVISEKQGIFAMLITHEFFKTFTKKEIADATQTIQVINALGVESKEEVDAMVKKAFDAGAIKANEPYDYGWMYGCSFHDLDGHMWEVMYIDEKNVPKEPGK